jgi:hypothetical protein
MVVYYYRTKRGKLVKSDKPPKGVPSYPQQPPLKQVFDYEDVVASAIEDELDKEDEQYEDAKLSDRIKPKREVNKKNVSRR